MYLMYICMLILVWVHRFFFSLWCNYQQTLSCYSFTPFSVLLFGMEQLGNDALLRLLVCLCVGGVLCVCLWCGCGVWSCCCTFLSYMICFVHICVHKLFFSINSVRERWDIIRAHVWQQCVCVFGSPVVSHSHDPFGRAKWPRSKFKQCKNRESCKLRIKHPPNGLCSCVIIW